MPEVIGIAIAKKLKGEIEELKTVDISVESGISGDARGRKRDRQVTGLGYELSNILLFIVIQPILIITFLFL